MNRQPRTYERRVKRFKPDKELDRRKLMENNPEYYLKKAEKVRNIYFKYKKEKFKKIEKYYKENNKEFTESEKEFWEEKMFKAFGDTQTKYHTLVKFISERDPMTGLLREAGFKERAVNYIRENKDCTFIFIDANKLKQVNDNLGHKFGDLYINVLSDAIADISRKYKITPARLGGDEFAIFMANEISQKRTRIIIKEIHTIFEEKWKQHNSEYIPSFSFGISKKSEINEDSNSGTYDTMKKKADERMYIHKQKNRK